MTNHLITVFTRHDDDAGGHGIVESEIVTAPKSHLGAHYGNIPYGYALLGLSIFAMIWISLTNSLNGNTVADIGLFKRGRKRKSSYPSRTAGSKRTISQLLFRKPSPRYVLTPLWIITIVGLCLIGDSFTTLNGFAKRMGRITFATFPLVIFMGLRPSPLPNTYYIKLLALHKWVARTAILLGSIHGICYIIFFIRAGTVSTKLVKFDNLLGVFILIGLLVVLVTSLRPFRQRYYQLFYALHYPLSWLFILLGLFHARPGVGFLALWCMFILSSQIFYRIFTSRTVAIQSVETISQTLYSVTLPRDALPDHFTVGSHIRLSKGPLWSLWQNWLQPTHPYTIASLASDQEVRLLIRKTRFTVDTKFVYTLSGPFSATVNQDILLLPDSGISSSKVVVFAGGSGISFAAPVIRALKQLGTPCKLIWLIRERSDLEVLDLVGVNEATIFITGTGIKNDIYSDIIAAEGGNTTNTKYNNEENAIEFDELLNSDGEITTPEEGDEEHGSVLPKKSTTSESGNNIEITYGRPDFDLAVADFITEQDTTVPGNSNVWAVACGPRLLVQDIQAWASGKHIKFTGEKYSL